MLIVICAPQVTYGRILAVHMICNLFSRPSSIMDIIHSGESMAKCVSDTAKERMPVQGVCRRCGYISSMDVCKVKENKNIALNGRSYIFTNYAPLQACVLLEGLNKGLPRLGVGKSAKSIAAFKAVRLQLSHKPVQSDEAFEPSGDEVIPPHSTNSYRKPKPAITKQ